MNYFIAAGDIIRFIAAIALPLKIWTSKNASGVSGKTQILYGLVYATRYLDLFLLYTHRCAFLTMMKILFIVFAGWTIYLIYFKFKDTYSRNEDSFKIGYSISAAGILAVLLNRGWSGNVFTYPELLERGLNFMEITWAFSIYLEVVAILPQFRMVYQDKTNETKSYIFYYLYAMGLYRALYAMNLIEKFHTHSYRSIISEPAGVIQSTIYIVFAFIYVLRKSPYSKMYEPPIAVNI